MSRVHPTVFPLDVVRRPGRFTYDRTDIPARVLAASAAVREDDRWTVIEARPDGAWAWLTIATETDLELVGVTAAIAPPLAEAGIACNVLAGHRHDHLLVPHERAGEALEILRHLDEHRPASRPSSEEAAALERASELIARLAAPGFGDLLMLLDREEGATDSDVAAAMPGRAKAVLGLLASLRESGLVETSDGVHRLSSTRPVPLAQLLRRLAAGPLVVPSAVAAYVDNGRVSRYPSRPDLERVLLSAVAAEVGPGSVHTERSLTTCLAELAHEPVELRRRLVDAGFIERTDSGSRYFVRLLADPSG